VLAAAMGALNAFYPNPLAVGCVFGIVHINGRNCKMHCRYLGLTN
jgi:hypothetical protein